MISLKIEGRPIDSRSHKESTRLLVRPKNATSIAWLIFWGTALIVGAVGWIVFHCDPSAWFNCMHFLSTLIEKLGLGKKMDQACEPCSRQPDYNKVKSPDYKPVRHAPAHWNSAREKIGVSVMGLLLTTTGFFAGVMSVLAMQKIVKPS